ncbi:MAG: hypothetical protein GF344_16335 [Chitinivibrionales bacterium]|nr:hypothetical protein [Chitinivibrionales bacterium]MBD3358266.1 hypothetical protein [Chitinivibrionales bacterium]
MKRSRSALYLAWVMLCMFILSCAPRANRFSTKIELRDESLNYVRRRGKTLMLMPVLTRRGPKTASSFSFHSMVDYLDEEGGRFSVVNSRSFERRIIAGKGVQGLENVRRWFYTGAVDSLAFHPYLWEAVEVDYVLVVKMTVGARITTFDRAETLRLGLEAELWDSDEGDIVWRAVTSGLVGASVVDDRTFIREGLAEIFSHLPIFRDKPTMNSW